MEWHLLTCGSPLPVCRMTGCWDLGADLSTFPVDSPVLVMTGCWDLGADLSVWMSAAAAGTIRAEPKPSSRLKASVPKCKRQPEWVFRLPLPPPVSPPERSPGLLPCPMAVSATAIRMPRRRLKTILWQCLFMVGGIRSVCGERQPENGKRGQAACDVNTQQLNPKLYSSFTSGGKPKVSVWPV